MVMQGYSLAEARFGPTLDVAVGYHSLHAPLASLLV
jgi:hypothetical protein